jgi:hypothetical protein
LAGDRQLPASTWSSCEAVKSLALVGGTRASPGWSGSAEAPGVTCCAHAVAGSINATISSQANGDRGRMRDGWLAWFAWFIV